MAQTKSDVIAVSLFIPVIPPTTTYQEKAWRVVNGKPIPYEPAKLKEARQKLLSYLARYKPKTLQPFTNAVELQVKWCFPRSGHQDGEYRITKPDTDNLQKLLKDCMTAVGFWEDDAQVCSEMVEKRWVRGIRFGGTASGIWIHIHEMENNK